MGRDIVARKRRPVERRAHEPRSARPALRVTLVLALLLLALGALGLGALSVLEYALRIPNADDIAARLCTAYRTQDYAFLLSEIDPTPVAPANTSPFDAATQKALVDELRALDTRAGNVTTCKPSRLEIGDTAPVGKRFYTLAMTRAHDASQTFTSVITLTQQPDGTWKATRNSNFIGNSG